MSNKKEPKHTQPIDMNMTIASINQAVEYWLENVIFKNKVSVKRVVFSEKDHFKITFNREKEQLCKY